MQVYNKYKEQKCYNVSKYVNFKSKTIPIKRISDKSLKIASSAIGAVEIARVVMNSVQKDSTEFACKLQGLTKQQIDLCTNPNGEISFEAIDLLKRLENENVEFKVIKKIIGKCKNNKENSSLNSDYIAISTDAIALVNKMLDNNYDINNITSSIAHSRKNCLYEHQPILLQAFSKYIDMHPEASKNTIEELGLCINSVNDSEQMVDFFDKCLEIEKNKKISIHVADLKKIIGLIQELPGGADFTLRLLQNGEEISQIEDKLSQLRKLFKSNKNSKQTQEVIKIALTHKKLFDEYKTQTSIVKRLGLESNSEQRKHALSLLKLMIEDEQYSPAQIREFADVRSKYNILNNVITELDSNVKIPKELLNAESISARLNNESKERVVASIRGFTKIYSDAIKKIETTKQKMLKHPELYVNGEFGSEEAQKNEIKDWFYNFYVSIAVLFEILDKEAIDYLMRLRLNNVGEYLDIIIYESLKDEGTELAKKLVRSHDINGEPFKPKQKLEMLDLVEAYNENKLSTEIISNMLEEDKVDIEKLQINLFHKIMLNAGMSENEIANIPKEKLMLWNTKYSHLLSRDFYEENSNPFKDVVNNVFKDIIKAANLDDFERYIHDTSNKYGEANEITQKKFKQLGLSYAKWLNPSKENELEFVAMDQNMEQLKNMGLEIVENMNVLTQTPAKSFITKQFKDFVKDDKFALPNEYLMSKTKIKDLLQKLTNEAEEGQLYQIWKRAKVNSNCGVFDKEIKAKGTLTVLEHLKQKLSDIDKIKMDNGPKMLTLKIKMWDRIPQKDLFQGNYSSCCIGIGRGNGCYMPHYLMDTAFNMIELVDISGKIVGNALCYFVTQSNGELAFIIDNIEICDAEKPSRGVQIQLRDAITKYADNIVKDVTGKNDTPIYISNNWNDVDVNDLPSIRDTVSFVGDIDCDEIYLDLYHDGDCNEVTRENLTRNNELLRLK